LLLRSLSWRRRWASLFSFKMSLMSRSCRCDAFLCAIKYSGYFLMPFWKCVDMCLIEIFDHFEQAGGCRLSCPGGLCHLNGRKGTPRSLWGCFDTKTCISFVNSRCPHKRKRSGNPKRAPKKVHTDATHQKPLWG
jgi:hypothetical protein